MYVIWCSAGLDVKRITTVWHVVNVHNVVYICKRCGSAGSLLSSAFWRHNTPAIDKRATVHQTCDALQYSSLSFVAFTQTQLSN